MTTDPASPPESGDSPAASSLPGLRAPSKRVSLVNMISLIAGVGGCVAAAVFFQQAKSARQQAVVALAQAQTANSRADQQARIAGTLFDALSASPADGNNGQAPTAREILGRVERELANVSDPALQARIQLRVAQGYKSLGKFSDATAAARAAVDLIRNDPTADEKDILATRAELAFCQLLAGDIPEGTTLVEELLAEAEDTLDANDPLRLAVLNASANADFMRGDTDQGVQKAREVLKGREDTIERDDPNRLFALKSRVIVLIADGKIKEAIPLAQKLSNAWNRSNPKHIAAMAAQSTLANLQSRVSGTQAESLETHGTFVDQLRSTLGENDPQTLRVTSNYLYALLQSKRFDDVIEVGEPALEKCREHLPASNMITAMTENALALAYHFKGRSAEAIPLLEHALQATREINGDQDPRTSEALANLFKIKVAAGQGAAARETGEEAVRMLKEHVGADKPKTQNAIAGLAAARLANQDFVGAAELLAEHYQWRKTTSGPASPATINTGTRLSECHRLAGNLPQAQAILDEVVPVAQDALGPKHRLTLISRIAQARAYTEAGQHQQAKALAKSTLDDSLLAVGPNKPLACDARRCYAETLMAGGEHAAAEEQARELFDVVKGAPFANPLRLALAANLIGEAQLQQGNAANAERLLTAIAKGLDKEYPEHTLTAVTHVLLGATLQDQQKLEAAEQALLHGHDLLVASEGQLSAPDRQRLELAKAELVELYEAQGNDVKAAEYRADEGR